MPIYLSNTIFSFSTLPFPFLGTCHRPCSPFSVSAALLPICSVMMENSLPTPLLDLSSLSIWQSSPHFCHYWGITLQAGASPASDSTALCHRLSYFTCSSDLASCLPQQLLSCLMSLLFAFILCLVHLTCNVHLSLSVTAHLPHLFSPIV